MTPSAIASVTSLAALLLIACVREEAQQIEAKARRATKRISYEMHETKDELGEELGELSEEARREAEEIGRDLREESRRVKRVAADSMLKVEVELDGAAERLTSD